ncbi:MAG: tRNA lysidine(34) synthetase TilS [Chitinophagaceae bacterium]|nr:tRNA lysidine(34) synthetase TilS [Chitinophagaceae bacterium]
MPAMNYNKPSTILAMNKHSPLLDAIAQLPKKPYLLAVSGGPDSMCLAHLFFTCQHTFAIAHVNFGLRENDSVLDEACVTTWAEAHQIPLFIERPNTKAFQDKEGISLQEAARQLRYTFFERIQTETSYKTLVTAHQANDEAETLLINLFRGTGLRGLRGIPSGEDHGIRPLLPFSRQQIMTYVEEEKIPFRTDASNLSDAYTRNALRLQVIPVLRELFPNWDDTMRQNAVRLNSAYTVMQREILRWQKLCTQQRGQDLYFFIENFRHDTEALTYIIETLRPYGFNAKQCEQVLQLLDRHSGAWVGNSHYRVIKHRNALIVSPRSTPNAGFLILEEQTEQMSTPQGRWQITRKAYHGEPLNNTPDVFYLDAQKLMWPLYAMPWRAGDYFYPLGMKKKKKVARFLMHAKLPISEKEKVWVMRSNQKICWVIGQRIDERFKVTDQTREVIIFTPSNH